LYTLVLESERGRSNILAFWIMECHCMFILSGRHRRPQISLLFCINDGARSSWTSMMYRLSNESCDLCSFPSTSMARRLRLPLHGKRIGQMGHTPPLALRMIACTNVRSVRSSPRRERRCACAHPAISRLECRRYASADHARSQCVKLVSPVSITICI